MVVVVVVVGRDEILKKTKAIPKKRGFSVFFEVSCI